MYFLGKYEPLIHKFSRNWKFFLVEHEVLSNNFDEKQLHLGKFLCILRTFCWELQRSREKRSEVWVLSSASLTRLLIGPTPFSASPYFSNAPLFQFHPTAQSGQEARRSLWVPKAFFPAYSSEIRLTPFILPALFLRWNDSLFPTTFQRQCAFWGV